MSFEEMMLNYLNEAEENQKVLNARSKKKAGALKHRCSKGSYELDVEHNGK